MYPSGRAVPAGPSRLLCGDLDGRHLAGRRDLCCPCMACGCLESGQATTAISRIGRLQTGRVFQFILACLAQSTAQKSVLWWAAKHRHHHLHSDTENDVHLAASSRASCTAISAGFSIGEHDATDLVKVGDFAGYPELMWLHRLELLPAVALAVLCFLVAGWSGLVVGFLWSTVLLYHATFCINSLAHVHGRKRYVTGDDSRNNWLLAFFTLGEGWHNNHHAYQSSVRQGFRWWEIDVTYYILKALSWVGVVWNMKAPPEQVLRNEQPLGARVINRAARELAGRFDAHDAGARDLVGAAPGRPRPSCSCRRCTTSSIARMTASMR